MLKDETLYRTLYTAQKMKFSIKDFFRKHDQLHGKLRIWSHLLEMYLMENFIFSLQTLVVSLDEENKTDES